MAGVLAFYVIPYLDVIRRAFVRTLTGEFAGFSNFYQVLENPAFRLAAANTAKMMSVSVPILVVFSLMLAVPLQKGIQGGEVVPERPAVPYGCPGGIGGAALAVYLREAGISERIFGSAWNSGDGLDEYGVCLCGSGIQLCVEEPGVQRHTLDCRTGGNPGGDQRGGTDRWGRRMGHIFPDYDPKLVFRVFYDHGTVSDQFL